MEVDESIDISGLSERNMYGSVIAGGEHDELKITRSCDNIHVKTVFKVYKP